MAGDAGSSSASSSQLLVLTEAPAFKSYRKIIQDLDLHGATPEQCRKKWLNLMKKYKDLKNPPTGAGNEAEELTWPFYDVMDAVMSGRPIITPPRLVASALADESPESPEDSNDHQPREAKRQRWKERPKP
ncbi:uncharacterized protein LOC119162421 [Rhipicephalus microplus]|uniref:uncharacterized protein LOC119162421 n=1 Tax=Rhipicephalus microplus TaxID=6941 RepID=UPI003F6B9390